MSNNYNVAVIGCDTLVGEAVLTLLEERGFPVASVIAVAAEGGGRVTFKEKHLKVESLDGFDFSRVELAFFCVDEELAEEYAPKAAAAGCVVIDDSPCFRLEEDVPLVVAEVNPEAIAGFRQQKIIANPGTNATLMTTVLKPLQDAAGIARVNVVTLQAVSGKDKAGVEELAKQSTAMFNLKTMESDVFEKQIAFNLLPQIGAILDDGYSREEVKLAWETAKILQRDVAVNATCVRVPVFHGHALVLHLELANELELKQVEARLEQAAAVTLFTDEVPTPAVDAVGEDSVLVGRLRQDSSHKKGIDLWLVADNVRKGAALNSIQIAEILIKEYLN
jgi:aspartate-semialdehyde dehydrogenase